MNVQLAGVTVHGRYRRLGAVKNPSSLRRRCRRRRTSDLGLGSKSRFTRSREGSGAGERAREKQRHIALHGSSPFVSNASSLLPFLIMVRNARRTVGSLKRRDRKLGP